MLRKEGKKSRRMEERRVGRAETDLSANMEDILWSHIEPPSHEINITYYLIAVAIKNLIFMTSLKMHKMAEQTSVTTLSSLTNFVLTAFSFCPLSKF